MRYRTRLIAAFALLTLLVVGTELLISYARETRHDKLVAVNNLQISSQHISDSIITLLGQSADELASVSRSLFLNEPGYTPDAIEKRLTELKTSSKTFNRYCLHQLDGTPVADTDPEKRIHLPVKLYDRAVAGETSIYVLPGRGGDTQPQIIFFVPVRRSLDQAPQRLLTGFFALKSFTDLYNQFSLFHPSQSRQIRLRLMTQSGLELYSSGPENLPDLPLVSGISQQQVLEDGDYLQIITPLRISTPRVAGVWQLQMQMEEKLLHTEAFTRMMRKLTVNSGMWVLGLALIWLLARRLSQPVEELSAAVNRLGNGDLTALEELQPRRDEFAALQANLQQMSGNLQESMASLRDSQVVFHSLFVAMAEGAALHRAHYDQDGRLDNYWLEEINPQYEAILGISREQVVGRLATAAYSANVAPYLDEYARVVATGQPCSFETFYEPLQLHLQISCCRIGSDRFATVFTDISSRIWHEETLRNTMSQLQQANEAKSMFLAVMSHEIRTPLNGITGMVQLLQDLDMPALQREFLNNIDSSAESLLSVINDILDFSKIEAGRMELEETAFCPRDFMHDTLRVMQLRAQAKGLELGLTCDDSLPVAISGDPHRLAQIINNLVSNAIKFTAAGEVNVIAYARRVDHQMVIFEVAVQDTGIGMDEETRRHIFEPFTQADSSTTRKFGGTGLGLAICRQLLDLMNGNISVVSSPGNGSTFSFTVPLKMAELRQESATCNAISLEQPLRILLAEDQPINQLFVAEILRKKGHEPILANNGQEAVELWRKEKPDMVLMDIQMPVMDGLKALATIRSAEYDLKQHVPIVALTAHAIVGDRERLLHAGFDGYLSKPLQVSKLFEEMARVLEAIKHEGLK